MVDSEQAENSGPVVAQRARNGVVVAAINVGDVLERIESGESQAEIAHAYARSPAWISGEISKACDGDAKTAERFARARASSAEAWLDRGLAVISSALDKTGGIDAGAARAYAQECARRAAIRNPQYRENINQSIELRGTVKVARELSNAELMAIASRPVGRSDAELIEAVDAVPRLPE